MRPTIKNIVAVLGVSTAQANAIRAVLLSSEKSGVDIDPALEFVNATVGAHGIEAVRGEIHVDNYFGDIVGLYVNTGDTYNGTVVYDTTKGTFSVTTLGFWVEQYERKYRII
jgi:hypothetical protein